MADMVTLDAVCPNVMTKTVNLLNSSTFISVTFQRTINPPCEILPKTPVSAVGRPVRGWCDESAISQEELWRKSAKNHIIIQPVCTMGCL